MNIPSNVEPLNISYETLRILLIEDNPTDAEYVQDLLEESEGNHFSVDVAERLSEGVERCDERSYDAILLDLGLPDSTGSETFETLSRYTPDVPIIILTGLEDRALGLELVRRGAQDYLVKGHFDYDRIERSIRYAIERMRTEQELAWESAINSTIARLYTPLITPTSTIEDIALAILNEAKLLTGSEHGFVALIDPVNRDMIAFGLTQMMLSECAIPEEKRQIRFPIGADGSYPALWGYAVNTKKGFYTNAPATHPVARGTPDGHTPLAQFLAAPVLIGEGVVGQIALANPGRDYTERDLMAVERLADVNALAIIRTQEEDEIKASLKERETLLKEIHHRVKNNMQIISSLLNESQRRIRSMALIQEKLYSSGLLAEIDFADYVESLIDELLQMYNIPLGTVTFTTDIENVRLGLDTVIPCGLIVNELTSNSLKHAFLNGRTGEVTVALQHANGAHTLTVLDTGVESPIDLDFRTTDSLGMQLVVTLVNQLEGTIELNRENGTAFVISFHVD